MGRPPCCDKVGIKKGPWTPEEDIILVSYIQEHGPGNWRSVPINAGLMRCSKSCRLRWTNYLRPGIKRGNFTPHEEGMIIHLQALLGNKWAAIASYLPQRTDNDIKNFWNTHLKKKLKKFQFPDMDSQQLSSYYTTNNYSNNHHNINPFVSKSYDQGRLGATSSAYASSEENISRLLQGWMIRSSSSSSSPASYLDGDRNTKFYDETFEKITPNVDNHEYLRSAANYGMIPSGDDHDQDLIMESILSFDRDLMSSEKSLSCGSSCQKGLVGSVVGDQEKVQFLDHDHQTKDSNIGTNPPLPVLEKWLLDESVISQMEFPSMF